MKKNVLCLVFALLLCLSACGQGASSETGGFPAGDALAQLEAYYGTDADALIDQLGLPDEYRGVTQSSLRSFNLPDPYEVEGYSFTESFHFDEAYLMDGFSLILSDRILDDGSQECVDAIYEACVAAYGDPAEGGEADRNMKWLVGEQTQLQMSFNWPQGESPLSIVLQYLKV